MRVDKRVVTQGRLNFIAIYNNESIEMDVLVSEW